MSNSSLVDYVAISPNKNSPRKYPITKITIHHMAGKLSVEECGKIFNGGRKASSNYGIGTDGRVGMYVEEGDRSWCSSNANNDHRAITIECANDGGEPDWHVSDTVYNKLIDLCVDICQRNNIERLNYTGDSSGNLTMHSMFTATACPGPYLKSKFKDIEIEVNRRLDKMNRIGDPVVKDSTVDQVFIFSSVLNGRKKPSTGPNTLWGKYITEGYYNVLDTTKDDKYTWYKIQTFDDGDLWAASVGAEFYKAEGASDWEIRYKELKGEFDILQEKFNKYENAIKSISEIISK